MAVCIPGESLSAVDGLQKRVWEGRGGQSNSTQAVGVGPMHAGSAEISMLMRGKKSVEPVHVAASSGGKHCASGCKWPRLASSATHSSSCSSLYRPAALQVHRHQQFRSMSACFNVHGWALYLMGWTGSHGHAFVDTAPASEPWPVLLDFLLFLLRHTATSYS